MSKTHTVLLGVTGSTAHGTAGPDSDIDRLGVYVAPTEEWLGLSPPSQKSSTTVSHKPSDQTLHEIAKFIRLATQCNPSVLELLWLPDYEVKDHTGAGLVARRSQFLSSRLVRASHLGYAVQQLERLKRRESGDFSSQTKNRTAKHARHIFRLSRQGLQLWMTGDMTVKMDGQDAALCREFGEDVASGNIEAAEQMIAQTSQAYDDSTTVLPEFPMELGEVNDWLVAKRLELVGKL